MLSSPSALLVMGEFQVPGRQLASGDTRPFTATRVPIPARCRDDLGRSRLPLQSSASGTGVRNSRSRSAPTTTTAAVPAVRGSPLSPWGPDPRRLNEQHPADRGHLRCWQVSQPFKQTDGDGPYGNRTSVVAAVGALNLGDLQLDIPEIDGDIQSLQVEMGAIFNDAGVATTFGRKRQALQALESGVALVDQSHWGRLRVAGEDRLMLLHNQSTMDFLRLQPGQAADTVFVTATGRCLDLVSCLVLPSSVLLMMDSKEGAQALTERLNKVIFRGDKVTVQDISSRTAQMSLLGPEAEEVLRELAADVLSEWLKGPTGRHLLLGFRGKPVFVAAISGLGPSVPGFTLVADESVAGDLYAAFAAKGAIPMGSDDWEVARTLSGRPTRGKELTNAHNPLEAGLYGAVSLNKGCYIGQETLAKLHLRDGVSRQLWGLRLSGPTEPGADITSELSKVGVVTSTCQDADGDWVGLGYLRSRLEGAQIQLEGVRVAVAGAPATVTAIPFATRKFSADSESPAARVMAAEPDGDASIAARLEAAKQKTAEAQAEKQAATEAKLRVMQERVAAWQAAQQKQQQSSSS